MNMTKIIKLKIIQHFFLVRRFPLYISMIKIQTQLKGAFYVKICASQKVQYSEITTTSV
jgi:hypothetical protein